MRFAEHDYGPYEEIRHRIAAHRQPFGNAISDQVSGEEAWLDISDATVRILAEDARAIWNEPRHSLAAQDMGALMVSYTIEFWEDEHGRKPVLEWIKNELTPTQRRALGTAMRTALQRLRPDVCDSKLGVGCPRERGVPAEDDR
jgi:hypothetical protein